MILQTDLGFAADLYETYNIYAILKLNNINISDAKCFLSKYSKMGAVSYTNYFLNLIIDNQLFHLFANEYVSNCSSLFIKDTNLPEDLLKYVVASSGYTFVFSEERLIKDMGKIFKDVYFYHLEVELSFVPSPNLLTPENNLCTKVFNDNTIGIGRNMSYLYHKPFMENIKFVHRIRDYMDLQYVNFNHFLITSGSIFNDYFNAKYNKIYEALANRTNNDLVILEKHG